MNIEIFSGCIPALMTPCTPDRTPDYAALARKGKELVDAGMSAVVYCGSMGDWPLLTDEERMIYELCDDAQKLEFPRAYLAHT